MKITGCCVIDRWLQLGVQVLAVQRKISKLVGSCMLMIMQGPGRSMRGLEQEGMCRLSAHKGHPSLKKSEDL